MSSKNPFRQTIQPPANPTSPPAHSERDFAAEFDGPLTTDPEQRRSSKPKRVRIQTPPPLSPESTRGSIFLDEPSPSLLEPEGRYLGSLPSEIVTDDSSDSTVDALELTSPSGAAKSSMVIQDRETVQNTKLNTSLHPEDELTTSTQVPNPFQRTLATMEPKEQSMRLNENMKPQARAEIATSNGTTRTPMDVDAFKRLLLTGSASPAQPNSSSSQGQPTATNITDYGSGTDTSSLSRQSLNDPSSSTHSDTSRTSYEAQTSDLDDNFNRTASSQKEAKRPAPPPPKPRHGKPVGTSAPVQTAAPPSSVTNDMSSSLATASNSETVSTLGDSSLPLDASRGQQQTASSLVSEPKSKAPPPPLARRTSNRATPTTSSPVPTSTDSPKAGQSQTRAPPLPPARRSAASASALASASTLARRSSDASAHSVNEVEAEPSTARPRSSSRSSSILSSRAMPPPVPPSRRRGSSRSSMDAPSPAEERPGLRLSTEMDRVVEERLAGDTGKKDWLADMDALQAEVVALKNQYKHAT